MRDYKGIKKGQCRCKTEFCVCTDVGEANSERAVQRKFTNLPDDSFFEKESA